MAEMVEMRCRQFRQLTIAAADQEEERRQIFPSQPNPRLGNPRGVQIARLIEDGPL